MKKALLIGINYIGTKHELGGCRNKSCKKIKYCSVPCRLSTSQHLFSTINL